MMIPIEVTLVGTVTDVNDVQKAKAPPSIIYARINNDYNGNGDYNDTN